MNKNNNRRLIAAASRFLTALLRVFDQHGGSWPFLVSANFFARGGRGMRCSGKFVVDAVEMAVLPRLEDA
jgi:hypothetical protein